VEDGFGLDVMAVVVGARLTADNVSGAEVLPKKPGPPAYVAVIEWLPTVSADVAKVAWPSEFKVDVPRRVVPSLKLTLPEGLRVVAVVG
jgi:hypothetical protein